MFRVVNNDTKDVPVFRFVAELKTAKHKVEVNLGGKEKALLDSDAKLQDALNDRKEMEKNLAKLQQEHEKTRDEREKLRVTSQSLEQKVLSSRLLQT